MNDAPLAVFLSHTSDLSGYPSPYSFVKAAKDAIREQGMTPVEMSGFIARDMSPADYCRELIERADVFLAVIGQRYGSLVPNLTPDVSYCEYEFAQAEALGKPCILLLLADEAPIPRSLMDLDGRSIAHFRRRLKMSGRTIGTFWSPRDLKGLVSDSLLHVRGPHPTGALPLTRASETVPWMVPSLGNLTHRSSIASDLHDLLMQGTSLNVGIVASVEGAGGIGKTSLAAMVCGEPSLRHRYPGGLVWLTIGEECSEEKLAALATSAAEALTGDVRPSSDPLVAGARLGEALDSAGPALLVLDDVWSSEQLLPFLIGGSTSRRLITTRNRTIVPDGTSSILVDVMDRAEARATVTAGVKGLSAEVVDDLLQATGRWPLLLGLINATITEACKSGTDPNIVGAFVLSRLRTDGPAALDVRSDRSRAKAFATTIQASVDRLPATVQERFYKLAIFPEDSAIPPSLLASYWSDSAESLDQGQVDSTIARLCALRLAQERWDSSGASIRLHDVVRWHLRQAAGAEQVASFNRLFVERLATAAPLITPTETAGPRRWWDLALSEPYLWDHLCWHMSEGNMTELLLNLSCDSRWVCAQTEAMSSVGPALADLQLVATDTSARLSAALRINEHLLTPRGGGAASTAAAFIIRLGEDSELELFLAPLDAELRATHLVGQWPLPDSPVLLMPPTPGHHRGRVRCCTFGSSSDIVVTGSDDGGARVWNRQLGTTVLLGPHRGSVVSCVISKDNSVVVTGSEDRVARAWDAKSGALLREFVGHAGSVTGCAISAEGSTIVTVSSDRSVRIWHVGSGVDREFARLGSSLLACALSTDGSTLVTAGDDRTAQVWDFEKGMRRNTLRGHSESVRCCVTSHDGTRVVTASADRTAALWDAMEGKQLLQLRGHSSGINGAAISEDGSIIVTCSADRTARVWSGKTGTELVLITGHQGGVNSCAVSPDGNFVATAGGDRTCRIWAAQTGEMVGTLPGESRGTNSCDAHGGSAVIVTADGDRKARLRRTDTGQVISVFDGHDGWVNGCALSLDMQSVATAGADGTVRVWRANDGLQLMRLKGHEGWVRSCKFVPHHPELLLSTGDDGIIILWDLHERRPLRVYKGHTDWVLGCAVSPDGQWFVSTSADHSAIIWRIETATPAGTLIGHEGWVRGCSISSDGALIATSSGDGTVKLWGSDRATLLRTLEGHNDWVNGCSISPLGEFIASVGRDRTLRIWDSRDGGCVASFLAGERLSDCHWIDDLSICVAGDAGTYLLRLVGDRGDA